MEKPKRRVGRFIWGLTEDDETLVVVADSARELAEILGTSTNAVSTGADRGVRRKTEPYSGCRYVKLRREPPVEERYSRQKIFKEGVVAIFRRNCPCARCNAPRIDDECANYMKCRAMMTWSGNTLRAFRVLCDIPEPGKGGTGR